MKRTFPLIVLSMVATLLLCAPVLAQDGDGDEKRKRDRRDVNVAVVDCSQVQNAVANQQANGGQYADATLDQDDAVATVAQDLNIGQSQVNECLSGIGRPGKKDPKKEVMSGTSPGGKLPETGGPGLLPAAVLLAGVGIFAAKMVRR